MASLQAAMRKIPPNKDGAEITEFCQRIDKQKRNRSAMSDIGQDHYSGLQYFQYDPQSFMIRVDQDLFRGSITNLSRGLIDSAVSVVGGNPLKPEGKPATEDRRDVRSAKVATAVCELHRQNNYSQLMRFRRLAEAARSGNVFVRTAYDPNLMGEIVLSGPELEMFEKLTGVKPVDVVRLQDGRFRATAPIGGTVEENINANLMLPETGVKKWQDVTRFAVIEYLPLHRAKTMFPDFEELFSSTYVPNVRGYMENYGNTWDPGFPNQQTRIRFDASGELVRVCEYWIKHGNLWDRQVCYGTANEVQLLQQNNIGFNPYVHIGWHQTWNFWCDSMYDDMYRPQLQFNKLATRKLQYLSKCAKNVMFLPSRSKYQPTNDPTVIVEFDGTGGTPQFVPMNPVMMQVLQEMQNELKADLRDVSQISAIMQGALPDRVSGASVRQAQEMGSSPLMAIREMERVAQQQIYRNVVYITQKTAGVRRLLPYVGQYGETFIREFEKSDLLSGTDVVMIEADMTKEGRDNRLDLGNTLYQEGAFSDQRIDETRRLVAYVDTGRLESARPELEVLNERQADEHCDLICLGKAVPSPMQVTPPPPTQPGQEQQLASPETQVMPYGPIVEIDTFEPLVADYQDHAVHIQVINTRIMASDVLPQHRQIMLLLMREHQQKIAEQQAQEARTQLDQTALTAAAQAEGAARNIALAAMLKEAEGGVPKSPAAGGYAGQASRRLRGSAPYGSKQAA